MEVKGGRGILHDLTFLFKKPKPHMEGYSISDHVHCKSKHPVYWMEDEWNGDNSI